MADKLTLPIRRVLEIDRALGSLDAVRKGKDEIVALEFSGVMRSNIIASATATAAVRWRHEQTDRALAKQHGVYQGMAETPENAKINDNYRHAVEEAMDVEVEIEITKLSLVGLLAKPGDKTFNAIPQSVLNRLAPILED